MNRRLREKQTQIHNRIGGLQFNDKLRKSNRRQTNSTTAAHSSSREVEGRQKTTTRAPDCPSRSRVLQAAVSDLALRHQERDESEEQTATRAGEAVRVRGDESRAGSRQGPRPRENRNQRPGRGNKTVLVPQSLKAHTSERGKRGKGDVKPPK